MKKIIKLTEKDINDLVNKIIKEQGRNKFSNMSDEELFKSDDTPYKWRNYGSKEWFSDVKDWDDERKKRRSRTPETPRTKNRR